MQNPVDLGGAHDFISEDLSPFLEPFVGGQYGGGVFIAPVHQLEKQHRAIVEALELPTENGRIRTYTYALGASTDAGDSARPHDWQH